MTRQKQPRLLRVLIALLILVCGMASPLQASAAVKLIPTAGFSINGKVVDGIQPINMDGEIYLPFIRLSKILNYNTIEYNSKNATFQLTDGSTILRATVGGSIARKGNEFIHIDALRWYNKTAYISLSASSALFNVYMYYKPENGMIVVEKPAQHYIVQHGDSLYDIARSHHITVAQLKSSNHLKTNTIYPGQRLHIPKNATTSEREPIREKTPVKKMTNVTAVRTNIITEAKKYLGAGYKYGATLAEAPSLFDCSSYTMLVFKQNGINIPRTSREQASKGIAVKQLQQGDLLFFTDPTTYSDGRVGHVGIYMADGSMIHASSSKGVTITKNVLNNPYWGKHYLFAKRLIK